MSIMTEKKLGFGAMRLPITDREDPKSIDLAQFQQMADLFLERGFRYIDTAYPYHDGYSEEAIRQCIVERYPRESFLLADKMPILQVKAPEDYDRFFTEQLRRCGVTYFDVYLLHNLGRDRYPNTERFGGFEFLKRLKEHGQARNIGFSFHDDAETLDRILTEHPEVDVVQLQINYTGKKTNMYYERYSMNHGKASECLKCGLCEKNCPQHIRIRDMLEEFAALYEG